MGDSTVDEIVDAEPEAQVDWLREQPPLLNPEDEDPADTIDTTNADEIEFIAAAQQAMQEALEEDEQEALGLLDDEHPPIGEDGLNDDTAAELELDSLDDSRSEEGEIPPELQAEVKAATGDLPKLGPGETEEAKAEAPAQEAEAQADPEGTAGEEAEEEKPKPRKAAPRESSISKIMEDLPEEEEPVGEAKRLSNKSPVTMMFEAAAQKSTGILRFSRQDGNLDLHMVEGRIVELSTTSDLLSLTRFLVNHHVCDQAQLDQAKENAPNVGGDLGASLISLGIIEAHIYLEQVANWTKNMLQNAVNWDTGTGQFFRRKINPAPIPLGFERYKTITAIVREGLQRKRIRDAFKDLENVPRQKARSDDITVNDLGLQPRELRLVRAINGVKTLEELNEEFKTKEDEVPALRTILYLMELGFADFHHSLRREKELERAAELDALATTLEEGSHFSILGVNEKTPDKEVASKYRDLVKQHHPDALDNNMRAELAAAHMRLFGLYKKAYDALKNQEKRKAYAFVVDQGFADEETAVRSIVRARVSKKKAEILVKVKKFKQAIKQIDEAVRLKPKDTELRIFKAFYEFMAADQTQQMEAAENAIMEIGKYIDENVESVDAHLFLGRLHKFTGDRAKSKEHFLTVTQLEPHNGEAASEIRLITLREEKQKKAESRKLSSIIPGKPDGSFVEAPKDARGNPMKESATQRQERLLKGAPSRAGSAISFIKSKIKKE